jgi:hypothetical protein
LSIFLHDYERFYYKKIETKGYSYWSVFILGIEASQGTATWHFPQPYLGL